MLQLPLYHYVLLGLLIGLLCGLLPAGLRLALTIVLAFALAEEYQVFSDTPGHLYLGGHSWIYLVLAVLISAAGWHWGRLRGLRHLGQAELEARWANVRRMSRF